MSTKVKVALRVATEHVLVLEKNTSRAYKKKANKQRAICLKRLQNANGAVRPGGALSL